MILEKLGVCSMPFELHLLVPWCFSVLVLYESSIECFICSMMMMLRRLCLIDNVLFLPLFLNQSYHSSKGGNSSQCWVIARSMYTTLLLYHDESCFESQLPFKQLEWWTPLTLVIWSQFLNESCFESQKNMMGLNGAFLIENGDLAASGLSFQPNICYVVKRIIWQNNQNDDIYVDHYIAI
jgi:hypothetical protein